MMIDEKKIKFFYDNKIYTYVRLFSKTFFNGSIQLIKDDSILFKDDKLGDIPILKTDMELIDYSKKVEGVD